MEGREQHGFSLAQVIGAEAQHMLTYAYHNVDGFCAISWHNSWRLTTSPNGNQLAWQAGRYRMPDLGDAR